MRTFRFGHVIFAMATLGVGILSLIYHDFALVWQPVPSDIPWRNALAVASGIVLVLCGVGLLYPRAATHYALALIIYELIWTVVRGGAIVRAPADIAGWLGLGEALTLVMGAWILYLLLPRFVTASPRRDNKTPLATARMLFGLCCVSFGLSHFAYAQFTAAMIPGWLPQHLRLFGLPTCNLSGRPC